MWKQVSDAYEVNIKLINKHIGARNNIVGEALTIADIYLVMTQLEMQQCFMDTALKKSC